MAPRVVDATAGAASHASYPALAALDVSSCVSLRPRAPRTRLPCRAALCLGVPSARPARGTVAGRATRLTRLRPVTSMGALGQPPAPVNGGAGVLGVGRPTVVAVRQWGVGRAGRPSQHVRCRRRHHTRCSPCCRPSAPGVSSGGHPLTLPLSCRPSLGGSEWR